MKGYQRGLLVVVISLFGLLVCLAASCQPAPTVLTKCEAEVTLDAVNQDLEILMTLNRLDLTGNQITDLLAVMDKLYGDIAKVQQQRAAAISALVPLLQEKRSALMLDKTPDEALETRIREAQDKVDQATDGLSDVWAKFAPQLKVVLSEAQVSIISGGDEANSQADELLEWIRGLSDAEFAEEGQANAAELADARVGLKADAIMKLFTDARKLSEADYKKNRAGLVGQLAKLYMPLPEAADEALASWFGQSRMGDILRERQQKLGGQ